MSTSSTTSFKPQRQKKQHLWKSEELTLPDRIPLLYYSSHTHPHRTHPLCRRTQIYCNRAVSTSSRSPIPPVSINSPAASPYRTIDPRTIILRRVPSTLRLRFTIPLTPLPTMLLRKPTVAARATASSITRHRSRAFGNVLLRVYDLDKERREEEQ